MPIDPKSQSELLEARALAEATMIAFERFGPLLPHEELDSLIASLDQANKLIRRFQERRQSPDLTAAMMAVDQVRQFLIQHRPN